MRNGLVIVFDEKSKIDKEVLIKPCFNKKVKICLVKNGNGQNILDLLYNFKEQSDCDISILDLKKQKKEMLAIKAGARFLSNDEELGLILYSKNISFLKQKIFKKISKLNIKDFLKKETDQRVLFRKIYDLQQVVNYE